MRSSDPSGEPPALMEQVSLWGGGGEGHCSTSWYGGATQEPPTIPPAPPPPPRVHFLDLGLECSEMRLCADAQLPPAAELRCCGLATAGGACGRGQMKVSQDHWCHVTRRCRSACMGSLSLQHLLPLCVCVCVRRVITDWEHHRRPLVADGGTATSSRFTSWCFHRRR